MKKWFIGIFLVGLSMGMFLVSFAEIYILPTKGTSTTYTFTVSVVYNNTNQPGSNLEVILEDLSTSSSCGKITNNAGIVSFTPAIDLSSYCDGDKLKIYISTPPAGYDGCLMVIQGKAEWNGYVFVLQLWQKSGQQSYSVGYETLTDGKGNVVTYSGKTVQQSTVGETIYFTATGSTSMSSTSSQYPQGARYVRVTYRIYMYKLDGNYQTQVDTDQASSEVSIPGNDDPIIKVSTNQPGTYRFKLEMEWVYLDQNKQPISGQNPHSSYQYSPSWVVKAPRIP